MFFAQPKKRALTGCRDVVCLAEDLLVFGIDFAISKLGGAQGGNRTRTTFGQGILSPSRLPIPPLAHIYMRYL